MPIQIDTRINVATVGTIVAVAVALGLYVGRIETAYAIRLDAAEGAICEIKSELQRARKDAIQIGVIGERVDGILRVLEEIKDDFRESSK